MSGLRGLIHTHTWVSPRSLLHLQMRRRLPVLVWAHGSRQGQLTSSSPAGAGGAPGCKCAASTSGTAGPPSRGDRRLAGKCKRETAVSGHWRSTRSHAQAITDRPCSESHAWSWMVLSWSILLVKKKKKVSCFRNRPEKWISSKVASWASYTDGYSFLT